MGSELNACPGASVLLTTPPSVFCCGQGMGPSLGVTREIVTKSGVRNLTGTVI